VDPAQLQEFTSWLGKRSYEARLARLGLGRLQEIARQNGKKGGRPKGSGKGRGNNAAQRDTQHGGISTKV
jgi:hypothetical protein